MDASSRRRALPLATALLAAALSTCLVACSDVDRDGAPAATTTATGDSPTATGTATATEATPQPSATAAITNTPEDDPAYRLHDLLVSGLTAETGAAPGALSELDVVTAPLPLPDRDLWVAVSSGSQIYDLDPDLARHVAGVYEQLADGSLVEVARLALESEPTYASGVEVLPVAGEQGLPAWIAIDGLTGAHSGTFELLRFDGIELTSALWWFSPSPGAAVLEDLDGDGAPEVILNASDPYVFCYACGVREEAEVVYRWDGPDLVAVNIAPVEGDSTASALTRSAVAFVEADLWADARDAMAEAAEAAPEDPEVRWLRIVIDRTAEARLAQAGLEPQPLVTNVLAGEYDAAVDLMRGLDPGDAFDPSGPLIAGTAAEDWESVAGDYLVDYATRAVAVRPELASAYTVRALGHVLASGDTTAALADLGQAIELAPSDPFYQAAAAYLAGQAR